MTDIDFSYKDKDKYYEMDDSEKPYADGPGKKRDFSAVNRNHHHRFNLRRPYPYPLSLSLTYTEEEEAKRNTISKKILLSG
ncbi:unnamed protein product [Sphenostylis stenocarpa]|uniref:Uncharacterized protein n=1 Tax=Sphenostylis stenocarpa TaxID=92480 RepID=A0AA86SXI1_9FABA|nr:unnamed protein product [Sphenostylis stenocarpa]